MALTEYCFRLLGRDDAVVAECFMLTSSHAEACEIADGLHIFDVAGAVEVACNGMQVYRAGHAL